MSEEYLREIQIGETLYKIRRFKGLKAALAGALMSRVMRELPQLQENAQTFRKEFREKNTTVITPALAKLPRFAGLELSDADFRASGGKIEFPEEPDGTAILVHIFPDMFDLASKELQKFLAVIVIPNRDLEEADDADNVDEALEKLGKRLMREGDIDELMELVVVGMEVLKEQMASKRDRLGKLQLPFLKWMMEEEKPTEAQAEAEALPTASEEPENSGLGETSQTPTETTPSPSPSSVPPSSSDSPSDSDGAEEPLSTPSPGTS
jgi:hypothetical protein